MGRYGILLFLVAMLGLSCVNIPAAVAQVSVYVGPGGVVVAPQRQERDRHDDEPRLQRRDFRDRDEDWRDRRNRRERRHNDRFERY